MLVNLRKLLRFIPAIVDTRLLPDILLVSRKTKHVVMLELTVPLADQIARQKNKYQQLVQECQEKGSIAKAMQIKNRRTLK